MSSSRSPDMASIPDLAPGSANLTVWSSPCPRAAQRLPSRSASIGSRLTAGPARLCERSGHPAAARGHYEVLLRSIKYRRPAPEMLLMFLDCRYLVGRRMTELISSSRPSPACCAGAVTCPVSTSELCSIRRGGAGRRARINPIVTICRFFSSNEPHQADPLAEISSVEACHASIASARACLTATAATSR